MTEPAFQLPTIKVCGLARREDVRAAVAAGAQACGVVHYPSSPRSVERAAIAELLSDIPADILTVGVVVDLQAAEAPAFVQETQVGALQLCGPQRAEDWRSAPVPLLRRIPVDATGARELEAWHGIAAGFVLDHPKSAGGSGETVDFALAAQLAALAPCLLAGGLSAGNVGAAIAAVRPAGVDASSRLEQLPGRKNPAAVLAFVRAATEALASPSSDSHAEHPIR